MEDKVKKKLDELLTLRVQLQEHYEQMVETYKVQRTVLDGVIDTLEKLLEKTPEEKAVGQ